MGCAEWPTPAGPTNASGVASGPQGATDAGDTSPGRRNSGPRRAGVPRHLVEREAVGGAQGSDRRRFHGRGSRPVGGVGRVRGRRRECGRLRGGRPGLDLGFGNRRQDYDNQE